VSIYRKGSPAALFIGQALNVDRTVYAGLTISNILVSKNGNTPVALSAPSTLTYYDHGWYSLLLDAGVMDSAGVLQIFADVDDVDCPLVSVTVQESSVYTAFITTATGSSGGLFFVGANGGAITATSASNDIRGIRVGSIAAGSSGGVPLVGSQIPTAGAGATGGLAIVGSLMGLTNTAITSAKIQDGALTAAKFASAALTAVKFGPGFITTGSMDSGALAAVGNEILQGDSYSADAAPMPTIASLVPTAYPVGWQGVGGLSQTGFEPPGSPNIEFVGSWTDAAAAPALVAGRRIRVYDAGSGAVSYRVVEEYTADYISGLPLFVLDRALPGDMEDVQFALADDSADATSWGGVPVTTGVPDAPVANATAWGTRVIGDGRTADMYLQGLVNRIDTDAAGTTGTLYSTDDTTPLKTFAMGRLSTDVGGVRSFDPE
jgi:hypothetical protein